jgi:anti-sigma B factor antagonist
MAAPLSTVSISTRQSGGATVVDINGDITLRSTPEVRKVLLEVLRDKRSDRVLVNLEKVRYIDSAGVASLVEALRVSRDAKRGFALFGLGRVPRQVLELTRLTKVFEIYDDEAAALGGPATPQS